MGRKPVVQVAGTLLASLALAGCQTSSTNRVNNQFQQPGTATASQNSTVNQTKPAVNAAVAANVNVPNNPNQLGINGQMTGQIGTYGAPSTSPNGFASQPSQMSQVGATRPGMPPSTPYIPGPPTPAPSGIQPISAMQSSSLTPPPVPASSSFGSASINCVSPPPPIVNLMPTGGQQSSFAAQPAAMRDPYQAPTAPGPMSASVVPAINASANMSIPQIPIGVQTNLTTYPSSPVIPGGVQFQGGLEVRN